MIKKSLHIVTAVTTAQIEFDKSTTMATPSSSSVSAPASAAPTATITTRPRGRGRKPVGAASAATAAPAALAAPAAAPAAAPSVVAAEAPAVVPSASAHVTSHSAHSLIIPAPRTRDQLDTKGLNGKIHEESQKYSSVILRHNTAAKALNDGKVKSADGVVRDLTDAERAQLTSELASPEAILESQLRLFALRPHRVRFSADSVSALCAVVENVLTTHARFAVENAVAASAKIVQLSHLYTEGVSALPCNVLLHPLATYRKAFRDASDERAAKKLASALEEQKKAIMSDFYLRFPETKPPKRARKVAAPEGTVAVPAVPAVSEAPAASDAPAAVPTEEVPVVAASAVESPEAKRYWHYVVRLFSELIGSNPAWAKQRISSDVKNHFSSLVHEFVDRVGTLLYNTVEFMPSKTISRRTVLFVIKMLVTDTHRMNETLVYSPCEVPHPSEIAKANKRKSEDSSYKLDIDALPKTAGYSVDIVRTFVDCDWDSLYSRVCDRLASLKEVPADAEAADAAVDALIG